MNNEYHLPVLLNKAVDYLLSPFYKNHIIVDGTTGGGGYSEAIAGKLSDDSRLICIDKDIYAIEHTARRLERFKAKVLFEKGNFADVKSLVNKNGYDKISGIVLDLGLSNYQLTKEPGFSYMHDTALDMRADKDSDLTAADVVNDYSSDELVNVFEKYGEIGNATRLSKAIIERRKTNKIETTDMFTDIIKDEYYLRGNAANKFLSKIYQSLRIEVNGELDDLERVLEESFQLLMNKGRIVVVSYHSLEDRIVKNFFRGKSAKGENTSTRKINILTKKVIIPDYKERSGNPKSRSAKLRAAEINDE